MIASLANSAINTGDAAGDTYYSIENLTGSSFADSLTGNSVANVIDGAGGIDTMSGKGGDDTYFVDHAADVIQETAGGAADVVLASTSYVLTAGAYVEQLITTSAAGTAAINLTGNELANSITGNAGSNAINGKGGADTLSGYLGDDIFVFDTALGAGNVDTIAAFSVADDTIHLENAIFAAVVGTGTLTAAQFATNTTGLAQDADDRIVYETDTGRLLYDSNGSAAGGAAQFATLSANLAVTNGDFFVI